MQIIKGIKILFLGLSIAVLAACGSTGTKTGDTGGTADTGEQGATPYELEERARLEQEEADRQAEIARQQAEQERLLSITTFYFDFDQSVVKPEARAALEAHAQYIANNGSSIVLEGHSDERGTREYNLALGERRAEAIARYLSVLGVSNAQIESVSYGEERPASLGHDNSAWSLNRRVELRYNN